ncbi:hypothetical protein HDU87_005416 [Geranomyces variabilis]|uniref:Uncharacterized protein n=1 Tax=Geranomyces variabilis TaxID=109894 RepID=A0AAD5TMC3_9FUNG|nr:hypothetical protein HDU87_005416 [Geranomyces variabilis]
MSDDIDAQIWAAQIARNKHSAEKASRVGSVSFDTDLYSEKGAANEDEDEGLENQTKKLSSYTAPRQILQETATMGDDGSGSMAGMSRKIPDRESEYHARRLNSQLSPERLQETRKEDDQRRQQTDSSVDLQAQTQAQAKVAVERAKAAAASAATGSTRKRRRDEMPKADAPACKRNRWDETPVEASTWARDATPRTDVGGVTPAGSKRSRWDEAPVGLLGLRVKPYLPQVCSTILRRLNSKSTKVCQQAADLISRIAIVKRTVCEEKPMGQLGVVLYEYLGEEYSEVLPQVY